MRRQLVSWATTALALITLAGCGGGGGGGSETRGEGEPGGDTIATEVETSVTIERDSITIEVDPTGDRSILTIESPTPLGAGAIRSGTCDDQREEVVDLGMIGLSLVSEVAVPFGELTGGGYILTVGDSVCVELVSE